MSSVAEEDCSEALADVHGGEALKEILELAESGTATRDAIAEHLVRVGASAGFLQADIALTVMEEIGLLGPVSGTAGCGAKTRRLLTPALARRVLNRLIKPAPDTQPA